MMAGGETVEDRRGRPAAPRWRASATSRSPRPSSNEARTELIAGVLRQPREAWTTSAFALGFALMMGPARPPPPIRKWPRIQAVTPAEDIMRVARQLS
jgi:hypothetical protein